MPYTHFRYIAYQVPTVGLDKKGNAIYGIPSPSINSPPTLKGKVGELGTDAKTHIPHDKM